MALQNAFGDLALDATLQTILTELQLKLDEGGTVALDAATIAALDTVTATLTNTDFPDAAALAKLEAIRVLLAAPLAVTGPLTDTQLRATPVPVSGTVTTGGLTDTQLRATPVPVSGTVTATGGLTDTQLRASAVSVTDTRLPTALGQAAAAASLPVTLSNENMQDVFVTGQASQTALNNNILLAVAGSGSYDTSSQSGQSVRSLYCQIISTGTVTTGAVTFEGSNDNTTFVTLDMFDDALMIGSPARTFSVASNTNRYFSGPIKYRYIRFRISTGLTGGVSLQAITRFSTLAFDPSVKTVAQPTASFLQVQCALPNLTKGTQGATGASTQDLKDAGRVRTLFSANGVAAGTTGTETAITLTKAADNAATSSAASFVITSAKRFRIEAINFCSRGHNTATAQVTTFNFRINTAGAVTTSSTPIILSIRSATIASNEWDRVTVPIPDGMEILGDGTIQFGITANAVYTTNAPTWDVNLIGYEY